MIAREEENILNTFKEIIVFFFLNVHEYSSYHKTPREREKKNRIYEPMK